MTIILPQPLSLLFTPDHTMQFPCGPFLGLETETTPTMEQLSVPRSYRPQFSDGEALNEFYMAPDNSNFVAQYEFPYVPSFAQDFASDPSLTPQTPKEFGIDFGFCSVEGDNYLLVDHHVLDADPIVDASITPDDGYVLCDSHQTVEMAMASPSSVSSVSENSSWNLVEPVQGESVWDLSALDPDSCDMSDRGNSEPLNWSGASTPQAQADVDAELEEASALLALSLIDCFRYPCPLKSCSKSFKRKEHAKRHYMTKHKPRTNYLRCEFCGKDTFTRQDNLNAHRRLHARVPPKHSSGVHFVPAALEMLQRVQKPTRYNGKLLRLHD